MRGRKPQHIRVERDAIGDMPPAGWLSDDAKAEWRRIVPILAERRILTDADIGTLESYCIAVGTVREMTVKIGRQGHIQEVYKLDREGAAVLTGTRKNPAVAVRAEAMTQARLLAAELGCTPVSRSRPSIDDNEGEDDLFGWGS